MALRSEAFLAFCLVAAAQPITFQARQDRLFRDRLAELTADASGIQAVASGKSLRWNWDSVQLLTLRGDSFVIRTYTDLRLLGGRDREWEFEKVPPGVSEKLFPLFEQHLGAKLDARIAVVGTAPEQWSVPAKLQERLGGPEGELHVYADRVVFRSPERNGSRTWLIQHVDTISSAGPFDLTIRTITNGESRFTLKRPLPEQQYEQLWRQLERRRSK